MAIRNVIVDYKALTKAPDARMARHLVQGLYDRGLTITLFTTESCDSAALLRPYGIPDVDLHVCREDVGVNRGGLAWIKAVTQSFNVQAWDLLYIGTTELDWRTAINSGVAYIHAGWVSPKPKPCLGASHSNRVLEIVDQFLLPAPRWSYSYDDDASNTHIRSLLPARETLPCSATRTFTLQDVFTRKRDVKVGSRSARNLLLLHALMSCYQEGLLTPNSYFCVYPSSTPGEVSKPIAEYLRPAATFVHGYYREDLLVRAQSTIDTSLERWRASQEGRTADVTIANQASTVHIGPAYSGKLRGKTVIVFDDFGTSGMSLDWARNLLEAAGTQKVVMVTMGRYRSRHTRYDPAPGMAVNPYAPNELDDSHFSTVQIPLAYDAAATVALEALIAANIDFPEGE